MKDMIKIITVENNLYAEWDEYVSQHADATPYHLIAWKQAVEQAYGHKGYYLLAKQHEAVVGVLPLIWIKSPLSSGSLCALPFCDVGGCLANSEIVEKELLSAAFLLAKEKSINVIDHRSGQHFPHDNDIALTDMQPAPKVRMIMDFPETSEALLAGFKSKLRSQIRKAEKNGLTSSTGRDAKHLDGFYQVFSRNMRDLGSPVHSKQWFENILAHYGDNMIIANVYSDDVVVGAGIVLFCGDKACIPWASTNADYNRLAPNMLLYWQLLKFSNDQHMQQFDFGRSTLGEGTYKFKSQWGAQPKLLNWQEFNPNGDLLKQGTSGGGQLRKKIEAIWRKLPVGFTTVVGPQVRKYISL